MSIEAEIELEDRNRETDSDDVEILQHHSYEQVMLDVNRCAGRLEHIRQVYHHRTDDDDPPYNSTEELADLSDGDESPEEICGHDGIGRLKKQSSMQEKLDQRELKRKLAKLIVKLLIKKPDFHYYQGLHDVCLTYMTLLGPEKAFDKLDGLLDTHFKIYMQPTMNETQDFMALIPMIIGLKDSKVQDFLDRAEVGTIFALSWVITWFSHVVQDELIVEKIFKYLETRDHHMILYLCAEIVIQSKSKLLELEAEMSTVHHFLTQIPKKEKLPWDDLMKEAKSTFSKWNPELLKRKLDYHRRSKLQLQNFNLLRSVAKNLGPVISSFMSPNGRTAILVLVVASAIALQFDRWIR